MKRSWCGTIILCCVAQHICPSVTGFGTNDFGDTMSRLSSRRTNHKLHAFQVSPLLRFRDREQQVSSEADSRSTENALSRETSKTVQTQHARHSNKSMSLIRAIWLNQAAIFLFATVFATIASLATTGTVDLSGFHWAGDSSFHSFFDWEMDALRVAEGVIAAFPMVMLGCLLEQSDRRDASLVNFSTTNMCISLFGRRKSVNDPDATDAPVMMVLATLIALSTGISEEILFRGYIPTGIEALTHSLPVAVLGQAFLFALAHISPKSSGSENMLVGGLQFVNGLWYGVIYAATGGDVLPCIIAHALYDSHVLCETWSTINKQMDYTQDAFQERLEISEIEALKKIQEEAGPALSSETLDLARRFFYAFDYEHKGSLCLSDVHRAVNYAFLNSRLVPERDEVESAFDYLIHKRHSSLDYPGDRLTVSEFLRLLFALKSRGTIPA